jgi:hypothetical protein
MEKGVLEGSSVDEVFSLFSDGKLERSLKVENTPVNCGWGGNGGRRVSKNQMPDLETRPPKMSQNGRDG